MTFCVRQGLAGLLCAGVLAVPAAMAAGKPAPAATVAAPMVMDTNIRTDNIVQAQRVWCEALLAISQAYREGGFSKARARAVTVLDNAYAYQYGPVAFKPTLASGAQTFRPTKAGALAYFVGGDQNFPQDSGFALKHWTACEARNEVLQVHGTFGLSMGNVMLTDASGTVTTVDKTWLFIREPDGNVRILVHHSSLPFSPAAKP